MIQAIMAVLFWAALATVAYTYFIYPVVLFLSFAVLQFCRDLQYVWGRFDRRVERLPETQVPAVTFIIPAHNEEKVLPEKLSNLRALDYPKERLQVVIISDGSTDGTNEILRQLHDPNIESIIIPERAGKANALNRGVARARHNILVFSDASTLFELDALRKLVRHFRNPRIGAVCGALRFRHNSESRQTEGVYWKYESALRLMESRLGATLNASGAVYALRREAYSPLPRRAVLDDLLIPLNVRRLGYGVTYDPEAVATDFPAESIRGEFARRVRIASGSFQALPELMRIRLDIWTAFSFFSHKLLRWVLPFFLLTLLASNLFLVDRSFYAVFLFLQLLFYIWAILGVTCYEQLKKVRYGLIGHFLLAMNAAFLVGLFRYVRNRQSIEWQRVS